MNLLAVVGAVTPPGRLDAAVRFAAETAAARPGVTASVLSLGEHRISFADGRPLEHFTDDSARVVGALKNLLDRTPGVALRAQPVGIVAMGATAHHYLGVDWHVRAVLAWFGALVVPTSVYLESRHFRDGKLEDSASRDALADLVGALVALAAVPL